MDKTTKIKDTKMKFPLKKYTDIKIFLKDYKRVHVNDALRSIGEIWFLKGKSKKQRENAQKKMLKLYQKYANIPRVLILVIFKI